MKFIIKIEKIIEPSILGGIIIEMDGKILTGKKENPNELVYNEELLHLFVPALLEKIPKILFDNEEIIERYYDYPGGIIIYHPKNSSEIGIQVGYPDHSKFYDGEAKIYYANRGEVVKQILDATNDFLNQIKTFLNSEPWISRLINKLIPLINEGNSQLAKYNNSKKNKIEQE
jgi:hypothetical protein